MAGNGQGLALLGIWKSSARH